MQGKLYRLNAQAIVQVARNQAQAIDKHAASFLETMPVARGYVDYIQEISREQIDRQNVDELNEVRSPLDIRMMFCNKTGQPIGWRADQDIKTLIELHGIEKAQQLGQMIDLTSGCALAWLRTDAETLEKLQKLDPYGYFMYAAGLYCQRVNGIGPGETKWNPRKQWLKPEYLHEFRMNLILGYAKLQSVPIAYIHEANEIWRKMLSLFASNSWASHADKPYSDNPQDYCSLDAIVHMRLSAEKKIRQIMLSVERHDYFVETGKIADAVKKHRGNGDNGMSQFRDQKRQLGEMEDDILAKIFIETGVTFQYSAVSRKQEMKGGAGQMATVKVEPAKPQMTGKLFDVAPGTKLQIKIGVKK